MSTLKARISVGFDCASHDDLRCVLGGFENDKEWPVLLTLTLGQLVLVTVCRFELIRRPRGSPWSEPWYQLVAEPIVTVALWTYIPQPSGPECPRSNERRAAARSRPPPGGLGRQPR